MTKLEIELADALRTLVNRHCDWDKGSAYVSVKFKENNDREIKEAKLVLAKIIN